MVNLDFYKNKTILVTGHTGFKGSWLCKILIKSGANVIGYSLNPPTTPNLFSLAQLEKQMISIIADIRDFKTLGDVIEKYRPECIFHLAAQPIVLESYRNPRYTYETNVMGTVNLLDQIRLHSFIRSVLIVTTDKVYQNDEIIDHSFTENEPLDGYDPYSNSKSCAELATHAYIRSFFANSKTSVSAVRSGNVIGGGDFAPNRIIPDCIRAIKDSRQILVRNPFSIRPFQHVLEALFLYLEIVEKQYSNSKYQGYYNVGPDQKDYVTIGELVDLFCSSWGNNTCWKSIEISLPHEASFLRLDNSKIKSVFDWHPCWHIKEAVSKVVDWTKVYFSEPENIPSEMDREIEEFQDNLF